MHPLSRRGLLGLFASGGAVLAGGRQAHAFSQEAATGKALALHQAACGATASHKELAAEVERLLGDAYTAEEKKQVVAGLTCPICGCSLAGSF